MTAEGVVGFVLSGSTTVSFEFELTSEGEERVVEGMLVVADGVVGRVEQVSLHSTLHRAGDAWAPARRAGVRIEVEGSRYSVARAAVLGSIAGGGGGLVAARSPPRPGAPVALLPSGAEGVRLLYGRRGEGDGVLWFGSLAGYDGLPLGFDVEALPMHLGVFGETGSGKSYGFGYLLELLAEVRVGGGVAAFPALVVDANGDYLDYWDHYVSGGGLGGYGGVVRLVAPRSPARRLPYTRVYTISLEGFSAREVAELAVVYKSGGELNELQVAGLERALRELEAEGYGVHELVAERPELVVDKLGELRGLLHPQTIRAAAAAFEKLHRDLVEEYQVIARGSPSIHRGFVDEATSRPLLAVLDFGAEGSPGLPLTVKQLVVGYLARLLYKAFVDYKLAGEERYILFALEEAQNYAPNTRVYPVGWSLARDYLSLIATQGRKFGICLAVISQRPSFVDPVIVSMLNTLIVHRLSPDDVAYVSRALGGLPPSIRERLPRLPRGVALVAGQANMLGEPVLVRIGARKVGHRMGSTRVSGFLSRLARRR